MIGPKTSTLVVAGFASALSFAGAVAFLVRTFSALPARVVATDVRPQPPKAEQQDYANVLKWEPATREHEPRELLPNDRRSIEADVLTRDLQARPTPSSPRTRVDGRFWEQKLWVTDDFQDFLSEVNQTANSRDGGAQYAIYRALAYCTDGARATQPDPQRHARCDRILKSHENLHLVPGRFLEQAVAAGYPRAIARQALLDIELQEKQEPIVEREQSRAQAEARLIKALNSNDAAVTWDVAAHIDSLYASDPRAERAAWVWRLAACNQEDSCGAKATALDGLCEQDHDCGQGESAREYIRRKSGELASLFARARAISDRLRAGTLDAQAFDATVSSLPEPPNRAGSAGSAAKLDVEPP